MPRQHNVEPLFGFCLDRPQSPSQPSGIDLVLVLVFILVLVLVWDQILGPILVVNLIMVLVICIIESCEIMLQTVASLNFIAFKNFGWQYDIFCPKDTSNWLLVISPQSHYLQPFIHLQVSCCSDSKLVKTGATSEQILSRWHLRWWRRHILLLLLLTLFTLCWCSFPVPRNAV